MGTYKIIWEPSEIEKAFSISHHDIAQAMRLFGNQAMVKLRGDLYCPGLFEVSNPQSLLINNGYGGIDIPCWVCNEELKASSTIMIVGESPYRIDHQCNKTTCLTLGTPYAIQFVDYPDQCWVYKQIFKKLLEEYNLYLTDVYKLWVNNRNANNVQKVKIYPHDNYPIIKKEIEQVKPDIIVTFGSEARNVVQKLLNNGSKIRVVHLLHPSQRNNGRWKKVFHVEPWEIPDFVVDFIKQNKEDMFSLIKQQP